MPSESGASSIAPTHVEAIAGYLEGAEVAFELVAHEPAMSATAEAHAAGISPEQVAKTIVLHDGSAYVIAAIPASERLDLRKLRELVGASRRLRLASEVEIARALPSFDVGAIPPFGPMLPAAELLDIRLASQERILCPAGDHRHSVLLDPREVVRITAATVADICES